MCLILFAGFPGLRERRTHQLLDSLVCGVRLRGQHLYATRA